MKHWTRHRLCNLIYGYLELWAARHSNKKEQVRSSFKNRPVDVWYGIGMGHGESLHIPGTLIGNGETIRITHKPWLDNFGWNKPYYDYPARKLPDTYKVRYDDYCYSEIGEVPRKLLVPGSVIDTKRLFPTRRYLTDEECLVLDIMES